MPRRRKVRRGSRRRSWMRKGAKMAGYAYSAYKGVQFLKELINVEKHYYDDTYVYNTVTNAGQISCLNPIAAGTDTMNRIGNSIMAKRITGTATMEYNTAATAGQYLRLMIIQDVNNQGIDPTLAEILQDTSNPVTSPIDVDNVARFWVLYNKIIPLDDYNSAKSLKIFRKLKFHIKFTGTSGNNYGMNSLYLVAVSDEPTNGPSMTISLRLFFIDN